MRATLRSLPPPGRWLARGGKITQLEGPAEDELTVLQRMVLIEFKTMDAAKAFFHSEEYQVARVDRLSIATAELTVHDRPPAPIARLHCIDDPKHSIFL